MSTNNKVGRPAGSVQTPRSILQQDLRDNVKLNKSWRELSERCLKILHKALDKSPDDPVLAMKILETISASLANGSKAIDLTAKHVVNNNEEEPSANVDNELQRLLYGGGKQ